MQEELNEKISLLIDDELGSSQALSLLRKIRQDDVLKNKLQRYQMMSQVLKNQNSQIIDSGFADNIHRKISGEPAYLQPVKKPRLNWRTAGFAVAASLVLAVVWLANRIDKQIYQYPQQEFALVMPQPLQAGALNPRFNDYLQAHDNAVYINNVAPVQPYARVVGYQQE